ncbi:anthranilate synthase component I [Chloroflexota bacterium]
MQLRDFNDFGSKEEQDKLVAVFRELPADLETPVSVFLKLGKTPPSFLLESVERGEQLGRYSFIGTNPYAVVQSSENEGFIRHKGEEIKFQLGTSYDGLDPLHLVKRLLVKYRVTQAPGLPRFFGGAVGYLSYDMVRFFEKLADCPEDELQLPDSAFMFTDPLIIFDHVQQKMKIVANVPGGVDNTVAYQEGKERIDAVLSNLNESLSPDSQIRFSTPTSHKQDPEFVSNFTQSEFVDIVNRAKEYIFAGDAFQIVPSQRLRRKTKAKPFDIYRALRMLNPSPYMFYLDFGNFQLIGSSPEMLVKLEEGRAETRPIAGTKPRGKTEEEDKELTASLEADPKERAEHTMLVDLGRNDLGRVCHHGSVKVPVYMSVEKYSHVSHLVSSVVGELKPGYDAFDLLRACFPAGTLSGAPKIRAMEIINELEGTRRGPYGGAVGYFGYGGNMDTCITIRTIVMIGDTVYLQGGCGVVADSDPLREYEETLNKVKALENAVCLAESWKA